jgi:hypothetical protein
MGIRCREEPIWVYSLYCNQMVPEICLLTESRRSSESRNRGIYACDVLVRSNLILQSEIREKYMLG